MKVAFFPGCMVDMFYPEIGIAAVNVLERLGCEVEMPEEQVCCGQGLLNSGYAKETVPVVNQLHVTDVGASFHHKVTYHKSCHVTRMLGIKEPPLKLLEAVDGLEYIEMVHAERCCGFGGTFSFKEPEISAEIVKEKCATIIETGADVVCGADVPCLMNIKGALARLHAQGAVDRDIRVMHIAQILDARE